MTYAPAGVARSTKDGLFATDTPVPPELAPFVRQAWSTRWRLAPGAEVVVPTLPSACVNLVAESNPRNESGPSVKYVGPRREVFRWTIADEGFTAGLAFHPGGFYRIWRKPLRELLGGVAPVEDAAVLARFLAGPDNATREQDLIGFVVASLGAPLPAADERALAETQAAFAHIVAAGECMAVRDLCREVGVNERTLERAFDRYIGVSPKLAIRTVRFQQALRAVLGATPVDWAELALRTGYSDQAHFCRDFVKLTGRTPGELRADSRDVGNVQYDEAGSD